MLTILAGFNDLDMAVKAGGALLDHGLEKEQLDLLAGQAHADRFHADGRHLEDLEKKVEGGVTTTTGADAAKGAAEGLGAGAIVGALAGLASLFIPGYGIVVGSGALATAIGAALGTAAGGAAVGGVTGYLKDLGVEESAAVDYDKTIQNDGAVIAVHLTNTKISDLDVRKILEKYHAIRITSTDHAVV